MTVVECILIEDCLAQKRVGKSVSKKPFRTGQRVRGTVENIALTPDSQVMALKTRDGFIIPEPFLNVIGAVDSGEKRGNSASSNSNEVQYAEVVEEEKGEKSNGAKSFMKAYESMKASDIIKRGAITSKHAVNFAVGGALVGVVYAMLKGKNKMIFSAIGAIGGGFIGNYYGKKIKENEKTEE